MKTETASFTSKGQIVIPSRLRREFEIEEGTKVIVQATADGILLKPITAVSIRKVRGLLKGSAGGKPLAEEWAEHKQGERELEEKKHGRNRS